MRIICTLILGLMIICGEVYLGVQTFYPQLIAQQADTVDEMLGNKKSILEDLNKDELAWLSQNKTVRIGTDPYFYPLETFDERGQYTGLGGDYLRILNHLTGLQFQVLRNENWAEAEKFAQKKDVDMLMAVVETERRNEFLLFTEPYIKLSGMIMAKRGSATENVSIENLTNKKIAVVESYFWHDYLVNNYPNLELVLANNTADALHKVADGKADFVVDYAFNLMEKIQVSGLYQIETVGEIASQKGHAIAVIQAQPELFSIINKAIATLSTKEHESLAQKWLTREKPVGTERRLQWYFFFFTQATLLCLGIIAWAKSSAQKAVQAKVQELKK